MKKFFVILTILLLCNSAFGESLTKQDGCSELEVTLYEHGCDKAKLQALSEADRHDFDFLDSESQLQKFVKMGLLVELKSEGNLIVLPMTVGRPYVRPAVKDFVLQLSRNLFANCGEPLYVTSALRFVSARKKLSNSPPETVHPTGMAVDLRTPPERCLDGFEAELLYLEAAGLIQTNREIWKDPHHHASVFQEQYQANKDLHPRVDEAQYKIRRGDTLWVIARRFGTTVNELMASNNLDSPDFLKVGQEIRLR